MNEQKVTFKYIMDTCRERFKEKRRKPKSLKQGIKKARESGKNAVITEIKFASPSRGKIFDIAKVGQKSMIEIVRKLAKIMQKANACAISVLTEGEFFKGKLSYLSAARKASSLPLLRKDFIFDELQAYESYFYGADALLLIPALLSMKELRKMKKTCNNLGLEAVFEIHSKEDAKKAIKADAEIILINNRNKNSLEVDLRRTEKLSRIIDNLSSEKHEILKISGSGIKNKEELNYVLSFADAALIGTSIMELNNLEEIESRIEEFVKA